MVELTVLHVSCSERADDDESVVFIYHRTSLAKTLEYRAKRFDNYTVVIVSDTTK